MGKRSYFRCDNHAFMKQNVNEFTLKILNVSFGHTKPK